MVLQTKFAQIKNIRNFAPTMTRKKDGLIWPSEGEYTRLNLKNN